MAEPESAAAATADDTAAHAPADADKNSDAPAEPSEQRSGSQDAAGTVSPSAPAEQAPLTHDDPEFECSECLTTASMAWRRDRKTQERLCSRCYQIKWPYGPRAAKRGAAVKSEVRVKAEPAAAAVLSPEKRRKLDVAAEAETEDPPSDTEYPAVDLDLCPPRLRVEGSGKEKLDGTYTLRTEPSRGKPAYQKEREGKTPIFLYHNKKWMLGVNFGCAKKMFGNIKSSHALTPCEPYPHAWKVDVDGVKVKTQVITMRVVDEAAAEAAPMEPLPTEPDLIGPPGSEAFTPGNVKPFSPGRKRHRKTHPDVGEVKAELKDERGGDEPAQEGAPENNNNAAGASEGSDSDSSESSSSSASASPPKAAAKAAEGVSAEGDPSKLPAFETRIRESLVKFNAKEALERVNKMYLMPKGFVKMSGLSVEMIKSFAERMKVEYTAKANAAAPKQPAGPPPAWLLEQTKAKKDVPGSLPTGPRAGTGLTTPPEDVVAPANRLPHRTAMPGRSVLKRPMLPRAQGRGRIVCPEGMPEEVRKVTSFRLDGERLWYQMPGAYVFCDYCDMSVPQTEGSLQGSPGSSQFAQNSFLCFPCMENLDGNFAGSTNFG